jgi:hypothetical protein
LLAPPTLPAASSERSPLQTVELLRKALRDPDAATVDSLLHSEYHGISLQGSPDHGRVYVEMRAKVISDVAALKPYDWDVGILASSVQIDSNGMAQVWARYVFYFKGTPNHCGYESYTLYQGRGLEGCQLCGYRQSAEGRSVDDVCASK